MTSVCGEGMQCSTFQTEMTDKICTVFPNDGPTIAFYNHCQAIRFKFESIVGYCTSLYHKGFACLPQPRVNDPIKQVMLQADNLMNHIASTVFSSLTNRKLAPGRCPTDLASTARLADPDCRAI